MWHRKKPWNRNPLIIFMFFALLRLTFKVYNWHSHSWIPPTIVGNLRECECQLYTLKVRVSIMKAKSIYRKGMLSNIVVRWGCPRTDQFQCHPLFLVWFNPCYAPTQVLVIIEKFKSQSTNVLKRPAIKLTDHDNCILPIIKI